MKSVSAALLGSVFTLGLLVVSGAQTLVPRGVAAGDAQYKQWPPRPKDIVNLDSCDFTEDCNTPVLRDSPLLVYTVPAGQVLVVTDFLTNETSSLALQENLGGVISLKGNARIGNYTNPHSFSITGFVFRGGSQVELSSTPIASGSGYWALTGYLTSWD